MLGNFYFLVLYICEYLYTWTSLYCLLPCSEGGGMKLTETEKKETAASASEGWDDDQWEVSPCNYTYTLLSQCVATVSALQVCCPG